MSYKQYPGSGYQPLFDLMNQEHGLTLLESEMADIIHVVKKMDPESPKGCVWVRCKDRYPAQDDKYFIKHGDIKSTALLTRNNKEYWVTIDALWLDESPTAHPDKEDAAGSGKEAQDFLEWAYENRWFNKEGDLWCYTFEMGTRISDKSYRENYMKTTSELYNLYKQSK